MVHRPGAAVPRRAHHRPRPAQPGQPVGAHPAVARGPRHDDLPDHALPGRGRLDGRTRPGHGPRDGHRRGHLRAAEGGPWRRPGQRPSGRRSRRRGECRASRAGSQRSTPCGSTARRRTCGSRTATPSSRPLVLSLAAEGIAVAGIELYPSDAGRCLPVLDRAQPARRRRCLPNPTACRPHPRGTSPKEHSHEPRRAPEPGQRHQHRDVARAEADAARPVQLGVLADPAGGLPRPVRTVAREQRRRAGRRVGVAVVRARHHRDERAVRHLDDRIQPALRDADRFARADAGHAAVTGRRCWLAGH